MHTKVAWSDKIQQVDKRNLKDTMFQYLEFWKNMESVVLRGRISSVVVGEEAVRGREKWECERERTNRERKKRMGSLAYISLMKNYSLVLGPTNDVQTRFSARRISMLQKGKVWEMKIPIQCTQLKKRVLLHTHWLSLCPHALFFPFFNS